jgi:gliding motility-associated-like protein
LSEAVITFPNVFTPNGDGFNDFFNATSSGVQALRFDIFDRWGVLIQTINLTGGDVTAPTSGWNGRTTAGNNATDGVYYWVATVTDYQNRVKDYSGFVHLLRSQP